MDIGVEEGCSDSARGWRPPRPDDLSQPIAWVSCKQACEALLTSRWTLRRLVKSGELKAGLHFRYWVMTPNQKRPKCQYHVGEIEKELRRISMRHHRLRFRKQAP